MLQKREWESYKKCECEIMANIAESNPVTIM